LRVDAVFPLVKEKNVATELLEKVNRRPVLLLKVASTAKEAGEVKDARVLVHGSAVPVADLVLIPRLVGIHAAEAEQLLIVVEK